MSWPQEPIHPLGLRATPRDWEELRDWWASDLYKRGLAALNAGFVWRSIQQEREQELRAWVAEGTANRLRPGSVNLFRDLHREYEQRLRGNRPV